MIENNLEKILPHNYPMILIDEVTDINIKEKYIITKVKIKKEMMFYNKEINGVSSLVGIEFMAQTIGCYAFYKNQQNEPKIGFLLGTRMYNNAIETFKLNQIFTIKALEIYENDGIVSFECFIFDKNNEECASATINVYQNDDAKDIIKGQNND